MEVHVGGVTAIYDDFADVIVGKLPLFVGVVIALGCVLLLLAFRSIGIPLKAAAMNLAAAAASFGVVVAIFQWGWGSELLGLGRAGPDRTLPAGDHGVGALRAVDGLPGVPGQPDVRGVAGDRRQPAGRPRRPRRDQPGDQLGRRHHDLRLPRLRAQRRPIIAMFGIALAAAVALDAFVLRTLLVPALMHMLGGANWWLPAWLDRRLPRISIEPPECRAAHARLPAQRPERTSPRARTRGRRVPVIGPDVQPKDDSRMFAIDLGDDGRSCARWSPGTPRSSSRTWSGDASSSASTSASRDRATDLDSARAFLRQYAEKAPPTLARFFGIWLDGKLVGGVLFRIFDTAQGNCEIGCWLEPAAAGPRPRHQGPPGPHRLGGRRARHAPRGVARRVREQEEPRRGRRLGMTREGVMRENYLVPGRTQDTEVWSVLAHEWAATRTA